MNKIAVFLSLLCSFNLFAGSDYLIQIKDNASMMSAFGPQSTFKVESVTKDWMLAKDLDSEQVEELKSHPDIAYIQPNYKMKLQVNFKVENAAISAILNSNIGQKDSNVLAIADNLDIPKKPAQAGTGTDPLLSNQWGMKDIGASQVWSKNKGSKNIIVAVIDTGVDYTHEDLVYNMWRNTKEIPNNNIDDDNNGYVDDIVGWDFAAKDNKPYDLYSTPWEMLLGGGNPGHGTHCAGNVAARGENGIGISGVAPNVKIMALRFISEKGQGTTADAIQSIHYAVDNGAQILSNSWGSEGEDPGEAAENKALKDAIQYAQDNNVIFIAAAGNGHKGVGYDNDIDPKPAYPASYDHDVIVSVAALDEKDALGSFSNWGKKTVDIGAPGVKVFSTVTQETKYSDTVIDFPGMKVTWDGTSMATPHVAGAAALYLSKHPSATYLDIKNAIINSAVTIPALDNKSVANGKLNVEALMSY